MSILSGPELVYYELSTGSSAVKLDTNHIIAHVPIQCAEVYVQKLRPNTRREESWRIRQNTLVASGTSYATVVCACSMSETRQSQVLPAHHERRFGLLRTTQHLPAVVEQASECLLLVCREASQLAALDNSLFGYRVTASDVNTVCDGSTTSALW